MMMARGVSALMLFSALLTAAPVAGASQEPGRSSGALQVLEAKIRTWSHRTMDAIYFERTPAKREALRLKLQKDIQTMPVLHQRILVGELISALDQEHLEIDTAFGRIKKIFFAGVVLSAVGVKAAASLKKSRAISFAFGLEVLSVAAYLQMDVTEDFIQEGIRDLRSELLNLSLALQASEAEQALK